ncbi:hypothetical protein AK812_SmicGene18093 [Symbiodinium microadriaticum]|uniref:Uncharacterized protein n=1 Tax=Symbiodinium microadriaticum TaxID=2951 RepID=A0A1Q9DW07_SYMMI|nr:hypothetical protein AK812_SmicGene18093 [Symbiodinium microadriaticum]CAE7897593.1 unnamed protein product [Symbiodinium sp. KB8]
MARPTSRRKVLTTSGELGSESTCCTVFKLQRELVSTRYLRRSGRALHFQAPLSVRKLETDDTDEFRLPLLIGMHLAPALHRT